MNSTGEKESKVAAIVLAAGEASRMGFPKQLLPVNGTPLVRRAVLAALEAGCHPVFVVVGARAGRVTEAISDLPARTVFCEDWALGMGASIRAGVRVAATGGPLAYLVSLADQPFVNASVLRRLLDKRPMDASRITAAYYNHGPGAPAIFGAGVLNELLSLSPNGGCKPLLSRAGDRLTLVDCPEAGRDVDTLEDYLAIVSFAPDESSTD